jgi:extracellular matrix protein 14
MKVVANGNPSLRPAFVSPAQASLAPYAPELFFSEYQRLSTIHIWMNEVAKPHAGHAELISVGSSYEGREILGLKLSGHWRDQGSAKRETILITGGAHGREWISVSSVNYLALQFISSYGKDTMRTRMADAFDWVFVPVLNPDGYEYSWTTDRFWRKTRQPTHYALCDGFDLDKAYGYQFDFSTSTHPCSNSFPGQMPWQATEAAQMKEWVMNQTDLQFVAYIDLHSYSQQVLYPYAYSCDSYPPSWENLEELAWGLARAMRLSSKGANYDIGRACEGNVVLDESGKEKRLPRLERGGGSSLDWFYHEARVRYAYQIKLPDTGSYGFLLPKEYIVSTGMSVARAMDFLGRFLLGEIGAANAIQRASHAAPHIPNAAALQTATVLTASTWVETGLSRVKHVCARPFYGIRDWAMRNMRA